MTGELQEPFFTLPASNTRLGHWIRQFKCLQSPQPPNLLNLASILLGLVLHQSSADCFPHPFWWAFSFEFKPGCIGRKETILSFELGPPDIWQCQAIDNSAVLPTCQSDGVGSRVSTLVFTFATTLQGFRGWGKSYTEQILNLYTQTVAACTPYI